MGTLIEFGGGNDPEEVVLRHLLRSINEEHGVNISLETQALKPYLPGLKCFVRAYTRPSKFTVTGFQPEQAPAVRSAMDKARQQLFADTLMNVLVAAGLLLHKVE